MLLSERRDGGFAGCLLRGPWGEAWRHGPIYWRFCWVGPARVGVAVAFGGLGLGWREGSAGRPAGRLPGRRRGVLPPTITSTGLRFRFGDAHGRFLRRVRVGLNWTAHARRWESSQPDPSVVPTKHPSTPATAPPHQQHSHLLQFSISISISDPQLQARSPSLRPAGAQQPASASGLLLCLSVCAWSYLIFAAQNQGGVGAEKEGKKRRGGRQRCAANLRGAGGFEHGRAPPARCRSQSGQQRPPRPPGLPPTVPPRPPWRAPWWTAPPATCSSARTGLRTWRSATSATATPGTDPSLFPCPDPSQIRAAAPTDSLPLPRDSMVTNDRGRLVSIARAIKCGFVPSSRVIPDALAFLGVGSQLEGLRAARILNYLPRVSLPGSSFVSAIYLPWSVCNLSYSRGGFIRSSLFNHNWAIVGLPISAPCSIC